MNLFLPHNTYLINNISITMKPTLVVERLALSFQVWKIVCLVHSQIIPNYKIGTCGFFDKHAALRS